MASILPRGTLVADADTDRQDEDVWIGTAEVSFTPARGPGRVPSPKHYTCWHLWFTAPGAVREPFWCLSHPSLNIPLELAKKYKCSCSEKFLYEKSWQLIYALKMKKKKEWSWCFSSLYYWKWSGYLSSSCLKNIPFLGLCGYFLLIFLIMIFPPPLCWVF